MDPKPLHIFSCITEIAYRIGRDYYGDKHYVWCSPSFDSHNPPSSTPQKIYRRLAEDVAGKDHHSAWILQNKMGLRKGVGLKEAAGVISNSTAKELLEWIAVAEISEFSPVILVAPFDRIEPLIHTVAIRDKAHPLSREYLIENLPGADFSPIRL